MISRHKAIIDLWRANPSLAECPIVFNRNHMSTDENGDKVVLPRAILYYMGLMENQRTSDAYVRVEQYRIRITAEQSDQATDLAELSHSVFAESGADFEDGTVIDMKLAGESYEQKREGAWSVNQDWNVRTSRDR